MKRLGIAAALALILACTSSTGPVAGVLSVTLTTPNSGGDGAILLSVAGPAPLTSATAGTGLLLFSEPPLAASGKFVLTGSLVAGTILTIGVADVAKASAYTVTIQQVAAPDYQLRDLTGYAVKVTR